MTNVKLRKWEPLDEGDLVRACNDPQIVRFLPGLPHPYTADVAQWWITQGAPAAWESGGAAFAVADSASGELLGAIGLSNVLKGRNQAEVGYWVAPWARGRGVATAATKAMTEWGFDNGFVRIELLAAAENSASHRVAYGAGYTREGVRRSAGPTREGGRRDLIAFARLLGDAPGPAPRALPDLPGGSISDGVIRLRRIGPDDVDSYFDINQFPEVRRVHLGPNITRGVALERCHEAESAWLAGERAECAIEDAATGAFAGHLGLSYRERFLGQAMIGYSLRPEFRGRGFATRAAILISDWAFAHAGVLRVIAGVFPGNEASMRVLERAGFTREGYFKARLPGHDGNRIDDIQFVRISPAVSLSVSLSVSPSASPS